MICKISKEIFYDKQYPLQQVIDDAISREDEEVFWMIVGEDKKYTGEELIQLRNNN